MTRTPSNRRHKRPQRPVETGEFVAFTRRILASMATRVAGNADHLSDLAALAGDVDAALVTAVAAARAEGYSWAEIGDRLGCTKQAAQQRFGRRIAEATA